MSRARHQSAVATRTSALQPRTRRDARRGRARDAILDVRTHAGFGPRARRSRDPPLQRLVTTNADRSRRLPVSWLWNPEGDYPYPGCGIRRFAEGENHTLVVES